MNDKYKKSNEILPRAKKVTPVGAQTYSKSYRYFCEGNSPLFLERGEGCYVWDVDGNKFIDFICALGAVTIGYNDSRVNEAVMRQLGKGISFSQPAEVSIELAEKLIEIIPCAEMVKFVKNGSDATAAAVRLARAYTGRDIVAVCGYHGMDDWYIGTTVNNLGVPEQISELGKTFEYNNIESLKALFEKYTGQIAAVILEPIQAEGPKNGFLEELKKIVHANGAILIFDEVVSGFRYALGGASELYKVTPDLAAIGKGMGNGLSISAVVGRKELLELIETKNVFISTTFGGETLSIAGALEAIKILEQSGTYEKIWNLGTMMLNGLKSLIQQNGLEKVISVSGLAPHCGVTCEGVGTLNYLDIQSVYQQKMTENGILTLGINNLNLSHTEKEIQKFLDSAEQAMIDIKKAIAQDSLEGILKGGKVNPVFKRNTK